MKTFDDNKKLWAKVVAKAWADEDFKRELINNPKQILTNEGAEISQGVNIHITEDEKNLKKSNEKDLYLYLPNQGDDIILEKLEDKKAARGCGGCGCYSDAS